MRRRDILRDEVREGRELLEEREASLAEREGRESTKRNAARLAKGGVALRWASAVGADAFTGAGVGVPLGFLFLASPVAGPLPVVVGMSVGGLVGLALGVWRAWEAFD